MRVNHLSRATNFLNVFVLVPKKQNSYRVTFSNATSKRRRKKRVRKFSGGYKYQEMVELIGGAEEGRTPGLRIAKWTTGKNVSYCLFESCSHRRNIRVFPFLPIPYHRIAVASGFFVHVLATWNWGQVNQFEMPIWHLKLFQNESANHCERHPEVSLTSEWADAMQVSLSRQFDFTITAIAP
jgi:hypothetical protein